MNYFDFLKNILLLRFYQTQHTGRKLTWLLAQCRGELSAYGFQRKYTFTVRVFIFKE